MLMGCISPYSGQTAEAEKEKSNMIEPLKEDGKNPYVKVKRIVRNEPDEPLAETENFKLIKQSDNYVLCKKYSGSCVKITNDCAQVILELNAELQELYNK